jgi:hypothetical protein
MAEFNEFMAEFNELKREFKALFNNLSQQMSVDIRDRCSALYIFYSLHSLTFFSTL